MIRLAFSEAKNATVSPMGSGQPNLPAGRFRSIKSATCSGVLFCWNRSQLLPGKSMDPGAMHLTYTFSFLRFGAMCLEMAVKGALPVM